MARPSKGTIPPEQTIVDCNQAVALLTNMHHWNCTKVNREEDDMPSYSITITHAGRRVTAQRRDFARAVVAALNKLREPRPDRKTARTDTPRHGLKLTE